MTRRSLSAGLLSYTSQARPDPYRPVEQILIDCQTISE